MSRPPKPIAVIKSEGKSHRTIKEIEFREKAESSTLSGAILKERPEVKNNTVAHKEFLRLNKLLKSLEKNDAVYEPVINRYCLLQAECADIEEQKIYFYNLVKELKKSFKEVADEFEDREFAATLLIDHSRQMANMQNGIIKLDANLQTKRRMLFDIERENIMTIAAALRSIPKQEEKGEDPLLKVLRGG